LLKIQLQFPQVPIAEDTASVCKIHRRPKPQ
jgi:hypothetical protein